jgi:hypothetical protein
VKEWIQKKSLIAMCLILAFVLSIGLLYPALIHADLAGMGGYDGFASREMMLKHGVWSSAASGRTMVYYLFAGAHLLWLLSAVILPLGAVILVRQLFEERKQAQGGDGRCEL